MRTLLSSLAVLAMAEALAAAEPTEIASGLKSPRCVAATIDGRRFVGTAEGIVELKKPKTEAVAKEAKEAKLIVLFQNVLFAASDEVLYRHDLGNGVTETWLKSTDLSAKSGPILDIALDEAGKLYVLARNEKDAAVLYTVGIKRGPRGKILRGEIKPLFDGKFTVADATAMTLDSQHHLLVLDGKSNELVRLRLGDQQREVAAKFEAKPWGLAFDQFGRLFVGAGNDVYGLPPGSAKPIVVGRVPKDCDRLAIDPVASTLIAVDRKLGSVVAIPASIPGWEIDTKPFALKTQPAFAGVKWTGWDSGEDTGVSNPFRPLVLTHAGDGSGRTFVATQHGVIHILESQEPKASKVFLDLTAKVLYKDSENEQGLLGLAFSPTFKTDGTFYLFYTDKSKRLQNVVSRFKVKKDKPNEADPASEEELLRVSHRFWNHDGGTLAFGPDGYLYIVLGDGGSANDPDDNAQNLGTLLGKILRIDVAKKGDSTPYAIPADNPFIGFKGAKPEIFARGVRNPWRLSFDRKTGTGWFGDVGQNLWEEIDLLKLGANYGWRRREGLHPFWTDGRGPAKEFTEPIWEYHHDVGKSITGGFVYRGKALPELDGYYVYADYVSGKIWGLKYDEKLERVVANKPIPVAAGVAILSFGEDEAGEIYYLTY